jgi:pimeloyl-ACP methyl ester carboxylesterase
VQRGRAEGPIWISQDSSTDRASARTLLAKEGKLNMPVLALGAEKSSGAGQAEIMRFVATNVTMSIIPASGHWIMEENPKATTHLIVDFLAK